MAIFPATAKPPTLNHRQIFRIYGIITLFFFIVNGVQYSNCSNGAIRLTGGSNGYEGRVEICANGVWGSFCDHEWDSRVASAICQQLGYVGQYD